MPAFLVRAKMAGRERLAPMLRAVVLDAWPRETLADALPFLLARLEVDPAGMGWYARYGLLGTGSRNRPSWWRTAASSDRSGAARWRSGTRCWRRFRGMPTRPKS
ncbi:hypothetical protein LIP_0484 [Limnochorda pilosa]|uniref:Uncharacterized protein n=1 Tax=Limnochorda pilosa TaxID=1555112 RepID=A0A0K2SGU9_LIMPI|nr:hypothetical protein LIP_0484 [Limnochorda pilosa]